MNERNGVIQAEKLTRFYGRKRGLIDVDIRVLPGEIFGYLGPNGAGKTTTIRILMDFIRAGSGKALVFGLDSRRASCQIRRRTGYLPGELFLYENLTVREYLLYSAHLRGGVEWNFVEELAERLDCDLSRSIRTLSQGNKQKVGVIQAMMHKPELLILDEPTNGLDPLIRQEFYSLVSEVRREGRTVFLSSHVLPEVERVCDRAAIIRSGKIVAVERVSDFRKRSLREVEIRFSEPAVVPVEPFRSLENVRNLEIEDNVLRCRILGDMDQLIKRAARYKIKELTSHQPGLEEVFLEYYGRTNHAE